MDKVTISGGVAYTQSGAREYVCYLDTSRINANTRLPPYKGICANSGSVSSSDDGTYQMYSCDQYLVNNKQVFQSDLDNARDACRNGY